MRAVFFTWLGGCACSQKEHAPHRRREATSPMTRDGGGLFSSVAKKREEESPPIDAWCHTPSLGRARLENRPPASARAASWATFLRHAQGRRLGTRAGGGGGSSACSATSPDHLKRARERAEHRVPERLLLEVRESGTLHCITSCPRAPPARGARHLAGRRRDGAIRERPREAAARSRPCRGRWRVEAGGVSR